MTGLLPVRLGYVGTLVRLSHLSVQRTFWKCSVPGAVTTLSHTNCSINASIEQVPVRLVLRFSE
jgi:hypothetical protein